MDTIATGFVPRVPARSSRRGSDKKLPAFTISIDAISAAPITNFVAFSSFAYCRP
jgi:hypothetical protein